MPAPMLKMANARSIARLYTAPPLLLDPERTEGAEQRYGHHEHLRRDGRGHYVHVADAQQLETRARRHLVADDHADDGGDGQCPHALTPPPSDGDEEEQVDE